MKNLKYPIGNRIRDLPFCSAVLQPTAPPRTPIKSNASVKKKKEQNMLTFCLVGLFLSIECHSGFEIPTSCKCAVSKKVLLLCFY
jgi:hypothetical protein